MSSGTAPAPSEVVAYFSAMVRRWGVLEGVGPLSGPAVPGGPSVRIITRNGLVRSVESLNGSGSLAPRQVAVAYLASEDAPQKECRWDYSYDEFGNLSAEEVSDAAGRPLYVCVYGTPLLSVTGAGLPRQSGRPGQTSARYFRDNAGVTRTKSGASAVEITRNSEGFDQRLEYFDGVGRRQPNDLWVFAQECEFDPRGLLTAVRDLGPALEPAPCSKGYAAARYTYDAAGNLTAQRYFDSGGQPVLTAEGYHAAEFTCDNHRNWTGTRLLGLAGEPVSSPVGFAGWIAAYDPAGNQISQMHMDARGAPTFIRDGYAGWRAAYDSRGLLIEQTFLDLEGKPVSNQDGVTRWSGSYGESGDLIAIIYLGETGEPSQDASGIARLERAYDDRGRLIRERYFDATGSPVRNRDGYAGFKSRYEGGNPVETVYLAPSGEPDWCGLGYARQVTRYDYRGNPTEERFFGPGEAPAEHADGYHCAIHSYDDHGNCTGTAYFHANGEPVYRNGYARWVGVYDAATGALARREYHDAVGRFARHTDGYAAELCQYDDWRRQVSATYRGVDGQPVASTGGYFGWLARYDSAGRMVERHYLDASGNLVQASGGYAAWAASYDERGNQLLRRFFNADGSHGADSRGVSAIAQRYDRCSNRIAEVWYGPDDKPFAGPGGVAATFWEYDGRRNPVSQTYIGPGGEKIAHKREGYAIWRASYDTRGNRVRQEFLGADEQPVSNSDGFVAIANEYDDRNRLAVRHQYTVNHEDYCTRTEYRPEGGRTEVFTSPRRKIVSEYDRAGRERSTSYFLPNGETPEPVRENDLTYWRRDVAYDEMGRRVSVTYSDPHSTPLRQQRFEYDRLGRCVAEETGNLREGHYERVREETEADGSLVRRTSLLSPDGKTLLAGPDGRAAWQEKFDARGNRLDLTNYDAAGNLTPYCGHYRAIAAYDSTSLLTGVDYAIPFHDATLVRPFRFPSGPAASLAFDSYGADGVARHHEAFVLRYSMAVGEALRYSIQTRAGSENRMAIHMVQRCTGVNPDGSMEIAVDLILGEETPKPGRSITMTMLRDGSIIRSSAESSISQPPFPTHPVFVGESWRKTVPFTLTNPYTNLPWKVDLTYTYELKEIEEIGHRRVAHIHQTVPHTEIGIGSDVVIGIDAHGENRIILDPGALLASEVATTVVYRFGEEQIAQDVSVLVRLEES